MPDPLGFNHLIRFDVPSIRCIWCHELMAPGTSEAAMTRHSRHHEQDRKAAEAASLAERGKAAQAVS